MKTRIVINDVKKIASSAPGSRTEWTIYGVVSEDGQVYKTFEGHYQNEVGNVIEIEYEKREKEGRKKGQIFIDYWILESPKPGRNIATPLPGASKPYIVEKNSMYRIIELLEQIEKNTKP